MRLLFEQDKKDYNEKGTQFIRPSVRGIVIRDGKIAMVHSLKYDYYELPGGGIEQGEAQHETLIREVKEETGLTIIPNSIREFGMVHRIQKGKIEDVFIQDNYYYICEAGLEIGFQQLDEYESEEEFKLEFVEPHYAIDINVSADHGSKAQDSRFVMMIEREIHVLEILIKENYC